MSNLDSKSSSQPSSESADANEESVAWHAAPVDEVFRRLETSAEGLSPDEAEKRLHAQGPNALIAEAGVKLSQLILTQTANPMVYLLAAAGAVSFLAGKVFDSAVILIIVIANIIIGVVQEYRAESALEALRKLSSPRARVVREGEALTIDAAEVVVGDVLVLETGDRVAADARLIVETDLRIDESALTGESEPVDKELVELDEETSLADRLTMVFSSTPVIAGRGLAIVTATGMRTVVGQIAQEVRDAKRQETPLQQRLAALSTKLGILSVVAGVLIFLLGVFRGLPVVDMMLFAVAAAVSAIPEGLPTAVSVSLALGVRRMAKRNALVRRLAAVETLGGCTVVCTDKTGTLTRNQMTVTRIWAAGEMFDVSGEGFEPLGDVRPCSGGAVVHVGETRISDLDPVGQLLSIGYLTNNAALSRDDAGEWRIDGNPTDGALLVAARKAGVSDEDAKPRVCEIPFSSSYKYMATLDDSGAGLRLHVKGAAERILGFCDRVLMHGEVVDLTDELKGRIHSAQLSLADEALRVVAAAYKEMPEGVCSVGGADAESGCVFVGMWGLLDPPRIEAAQAVASAQRAGITVKMITGDHAATGAAIARRVGILSGEHAADTVVTGVDLDKMSDEELESQVRGIAVFSRVEPRHKLRIVSALQKGGDIVSMTGDGVNDAPALKRADIGVAMGITGTEVSKEAADMVLADDNFATIVAAVEEGRVIYGNLQRVVAFLVMIALGQVMAIAVSQVIGWPLPITPVMVLWANLVVASTLTIPLGVEPKHEDVLALAPRSPKDGIIDRRTLWRIVTGSVLKAAGMLAVFGYFLETSTLSHAQAMAFTTLVAFEWAQAIGCRSWNVPITALGRFTNRGLTLGMVAGIALQWVAVSSVAADKVLGIKPLGLADWGIALLVGSTGLLLSVIMNALERRKREGEA